MILCHDLFLQDMDDFLRNAKNPVGRPIQFTPGAPRDYVVTLQLGELRCPIGIDQPFQVGPTLPEHTGDVH